MGYIYKNVSGESINIGGYQFSVDQELRSDIIIDATLNGVHFENAVRDGLLDLLDESAPPSVESEEGEPEEGEPKEEEPEE